jgi:hypothetical protein
MSFTRAMFTKRNFANFIDDGLIKSGGKSK